jgi:endonuclease-3
MKESLKQKRERAMEVARLFEAHYPNVGGYLDHGSAFQLMIAVILSAQTTDAAVNKITPELFERWPDAPSLASALPAQIERVIKSIGLYKTKSVRIVQCANALLELYGGVVPTSVDELLKLPGVGRKSANVISNSAFGNIEGIAVDTHVFRIAHRLGFSESNTADGVERDLLKLYPQSEWEHINHRWIALGREVCKAPNALCSECFLSHLCPSG